MSADPKVQNLSTGKYLAPEEDGPAAAADEPEAPAGLATLGEILESSHGRFVMRIRERQRKGEIE